MTCIIPSARAASVPGSGRRCRSACSAVRERRGSTTTMRAPFFFASSAKSQPCSLLTAGFAPHTRMKRLWARSLGRIPVLVPIVGGRPGWGGRPPARARGGPGDALEAALALLAGAPERMQDPVGAEDDVVRIPAHARAQPAAREGVIRVALEPDDATA